MSKPLRNFDKFEVGHYYVYTGENINDWSKEMNAILERKSKIRKCLKASFSNKAGAVFEGVEDGYWNYKKGFDYWVEVENPDAVFEVGDDVLRYDKIIKNWEISKVTKDYFEWDYNKNGCESVYSFYYICKRKHNKKEESVTKNKRYLCPYCKNDRTGFLGLTSKKGESVKCGNCLNLYRYDKESDSLVMWDTLKQENVPRETHIKMSLGSVIKEPMKLEFEFKKDDSWSVANALQRWHSLWVGMGKDVDKKENVFKKYIRNKKYMKFVKEKKK